MRHRKEKKTSYDAVKFIKMVFMKNFSQNMMQIRMFVHRPCVDTFVHPKNIQKILKRQAGDDEETETTNLPKRA